MWVRSYIVVLNRLRVALLVISLFYEFGGVGIVFLSHSFFLFFSCNSGGVAAFWRISIKFLCTVKYE